MKPVRAWPWGMSMGTAWWTSIFAASKGPTRFIATWGIGSLRMSRRLRGLSCSNQFSTGCALVDADGDGHLDLLLNSTGRRDPAFSELDGKGHFLKTDGGLARRLGATSMGLADMAGSGNLDLYVCDYRTGHGARSSSRIEVRQPQEAGRDGDRHAERPFFCAARAGGRAVRGGAGRAQLLLPPRGGRFSPMPWTTGLFVDEDGRNLRESPTDWSLSVLFRDLNGDGLPDLYVCNDFAHWPDRLWLNQNGRRFQAAPRPALRHVSLSSMAVDAADINRDGFDDFFVADMLSPGRESRAWQRPNFMHGMDAGMTEDANARPEAPRSTLPVGARGRHVCRDRAVGGGGGHGLEHQRVVLGCRFGRVGGFADQLGATSMICKTRTRWGGLGAR